MYNSTGRESMDITDGNSENGGKFQPRWKNQGGIRKKRKTMAERQHRLKKYVQPKNALMCLHELVPGTSLKFEQESGPITVGTPICMSVEVNGQKFRGFGSSKLIAKQAAAEAALVSFVKPPPASDDSVEDKTPWGVLASFAMFKLFNEWKEGRIGSYSTMGSTSFGGVSMPDPAFAKTLQTMLNRGMMPMDSSDVKPNVDVFSAYLSDGAAKGSTVNGDGKMIPNPSKKVPDNATQIHPVMLLHQMRPSLTFDHTTETKGDHPEFTVTCNIDGRRFQGSGPNLKKAKYDLALKSNRQLFGVMSTYTPGPGN